MLKKKLLEKMRLLEKIAAKTGDWLLPMRRLLPAAFVPRRDFAHLHRRGWLDLRHHFTLSRAGAFRSNHFCLLPAFRSTSHWSHG